MGIAEDLIRRTGFDDQPILQEHHTIRDLTRE
jgi:hypothetical protein